MTADKYDVAKIRKALDATLKQKHKDPTAFLPPKAKAGEEHLYRFFVLPPLQRGDKCANGVASNSMDSFLINAGTHFYNKKAYACSRVTPFATDEDICPICDIGFKLLGEATTKEEKQRISKVWMPWVKYYINIYFPKKTKQEDLAGKVLVYGANKTVIDVMTSCIYNDDEGDEYQPKPCGIFYNENAAYLFQLSYKLKGDFNTYEASSFIVNSKIGKMPIAASDEEIQAILDSRYDLFLRCEKPNMAELNKLSSIMLEGDDDDDDDGFNKREEASEPAAKPEAPKTEAKAKTEAKPKSEAKVGKLGKQAEVQTEAKAEVEVPVEVPTGASDSIDDVEALLGDLFKE
jgi:hypothetical protein